jgi:hypothetical protein
LWDKSLQILPFSQPSTNKVDKHSSLRASIIPDWRGSYADLPGALSTVCSAALAHWMLGGHMLSTQAWLYGPKATAIQDARRKMGR